MKGNQSWNRTVLPDPSEVMNRSRPAVDNRNVIENWHWWRFWAICQTAFKRRNYTVALMAQKQLCAITLMQGSQPKPAEIAFRDDASRVATLTARDAEILRYLQNTTYRKNDDEGEKLN
jgi:hypothetical protein